MIQDRVCCGGMFYGYLLLLLRALGKNFVIYLAAGGPCRSSRPLLHTFVAYPLTEFAVTDEEVERCFSTVSCLNFFNLYFKERSEFYVALVVIYFLLPLEN